MIPCMERLVVCYDSSREDKCQLKALNSDRGSLLNVLLDKSVLNASDT